MPLPGYQNQMLFLGSRRAVFNLECTSVFNSMGHKVKSVKIKLIPAAPHDARMFYEPVKCFMNAGVEKSASKNGALLPFIPFRLM
jgi:uncharacterized membrane protein